MFVLVLVGCAPRPATVAPSGFRPRPTAVEPTAPLPERQPLAPPQAALQLGLMPLSSTGVTDWRLQHATWDGRGVLIAILDSGLDPTVPGFAGRVLDLREMSGEGDVALAPVTPQGERLALDSATVIGGASVVRSLADDTAWFGGVMHELPFGDAPAADFNGNGTNRDRYGIVVFKRAGAWVALIDTNGDGSFADETPVGDYLARAETFTWHSRWVPRGRGPIAGAVNLSEVDGQPRLSIFLDTSGHGTHVAGIATGRGMYGLPGFDGVAPGAQILAIKIANNTRGGVTTNGSMLRAMEYAVAFARQRNLPLVMNMSFGIGNEQEGRAVMDSIVDAFLIAHPEILFVIAAGNDGPGTSTMGMPGSAELALTAGALYPGAFAAPQFGAPSGDVLGWWGSRGGELAKPDVVVPGMAFSTVPRWNTGEEIKLGTSMAAPHLTGLGALLLSAAIQERRTVSGRDLKAALIRTARPVGGGSYVDQGAGLARVNEAWRWLAAGRMADVYRVEAVAPRPVGSAPMRTETSPPGRYYRNGLADTLTNFRVSAVPDRLTARPPDRRFRLVSDVAWARAADTVTVTSSAVIPVRYDRAAVSRPGRYVGTVTGYDAADSAAGAVFRLVTTIVAGEPLDGGRLTQRARKVGGGQSARTFVTASAEGVLGVRATLRGDTTAPAQLFVYESSGRPVRSTPDGVAFGGDHGAGAVIRVNRNDLASGTYEIIVQAMPGREITYDLEVVSPAVRVAADSAAGAVSFSSDRDTTLSIQLEQIGSDTIYTAAMPGGEINRRRFTVPAWARGMQVEVAATEGWLDVTDLAISLMGADGERLEGGAMNYPYHRLGMDFEDNGNPREVIVELFPGLANPLPQTALNARVRVMFTPASARALGGSVPLSLTARAPARVPLPAVQPFGPAGWTDRIRVRAGGPGVWMPIEAEVSVRR